MPIDSNQINAMMAQQNAMFAGNAAYATYLTNRSHGGSTPPPPSWAMAPGGTTMAGPGISDPYYAASQLSFAGSVGAMAGYRPFGYTTHDIDAAAGRKVFGELGGAVSTGVTHGVLPAAAFLSSMHLMRYDPLWGSAFRVPGAIGAAGSAMAGGSGIMGGLAAGARHAVSPFMTMGGLMGAGAYYGVGKAFDYSIGNMEQYYALGRDMDAAGSLMPQSRSSAVGGGFNVAERGAFAKGIRELDIEEMYLDFAQIRRISKGLVERGYITSTRDFADFSRQIKDGVKTIREIHEFLNVSFEEATNLLTSVKQLGVSDIASQKRMVVGMGSLERGLGLQQGTISNIAGMGAQAAPSLGLTRLGGAEMFTKLAAGFREGASMGLIPKELLTEMGVTDTRDVNQLGGLVSNVAGNAFNAFRSMPMGQQILAMTATQGPGGEMQINQGAMQAVRRGQYGEIMRMAEEAFRKDPEGMLMRMNDPLFNTQLATLLKDDLPKFVTDMVKMGAKSLFRSDSAQAQRMFAQRYGIDWQAYSALSAYAGNQGRIQSNIDISMANDQVLQQSALNARNTGMGGSFRRNVARPLARGADIFKGIGQGMAEPFEYMGEWYDETVRGVAKRPLSRASLMSSAGAMEYYRTHQSGPLDLEVGEGSLWASMVGNTAADFIATSSGLGSMVQDSFRRKPGTGDVLLGGGRHISREALSGWQSYLEQNAPAAEDVSRVGRDLTTRLTSKGKNLTDLYNTRGPNNKSFAGTAMSLEERRIFSTVTWMQPSLPPAAGITQRELTRLSHEPMTNNNSAELRSIMRKVTRAYYQYASPEVEEAIAVPKEHVSALAATRYAETLGGEKEAAALLEKSLSRFGGSGLISQLRTSERGIEAMEAIQGYMSATSDKARLGYAGTITEILGESTAKTLFSGISGYEGGKRSALDWLTGTPEYKSRSEMLNKSILIMKGSRAQKELDHYKEQARGVLKDVDPTLQGILGEEVEGLGSNWMGTYDKLWGIMQEREKKEGSRAFEWMHGELGKMGDEWVGKFGATRGLLNITDAERGASQRLGLGETGEAVNYLEALVPGAAKMMEASATRGQDLLSDKGLKDVLRMDDYNIQTFREMLKKGGDTRAAGDIYGRAALPGLGGGTRVESASVDPATVKGFTDSLTQAASRLTDLVRVIDWAKIPRAQ